MAEPWSTARDNSKPCVAAGMAPAPHGLANANGVAVDVALQQAKGPARFVVEGMAEVMAKGLTAGDSRSFLGRHDISACPVAAPRNMPATTGYAKNLGCWASIARRQAALASRSLG